MKPDSDMHCVTALKSSINGIVQALSLGHLSYDYSTSLQHLSLDVQLSRVCHTYTTFPSSISGSAFPITISKTVLTQREQGERPSVREHIQYSIHFGDNIVLGFSEIDYERILNYAQTLYESSEKRKSGEFRHILTAVSESLGV